MNPLQTLWHAPGRTWAGMMKAGTLRLWAIILGAPPLCGMIVWCIDLLAKAAVAPDPVRIEIVNHIADIAKMLVAVVAVIVASLAMMKVHATTPAGTLSIEGDDDDHPAVVTTTTTEVKP